MEAPLHPEEDKRLAALRRYEILDTSPEVAYDRITALASRLFDAPIALVTLVDEHRQWFKSAHGFATRETPREMAFCAHAILTPEVMVVPNAKADERFQDNPLVTGQPDIRFYAGAPLISPDGSPLGTLCVIDLAERTNFTPADQATLADLAAMVVDEMGFRLAAQSLLAANAQLAQTAAHDALTKLPNRLEFEYQLQAALAQASAAGTCFAVLYMDLDRFKPVNDTYGHAAGDELLRQASTRMKTLLPADATLARVGGDEFVALVPRMSQPAAEACAGQLCSGLNAPFLIEGRQTVITVSVGIATYPEDAEGAVELVREADHAMYEAKRDGGDCFRRALVTSLQSN